MQDWGICFEFFDAVGCKLDYVIVIEVLLLILLIINLQFKF